MSKSWFAYSRGSGEPTISVWFAAGRHARLVLLGEDLPDEVSAATHADLVEDGLEVIPHPLRRDVQLSGDFGRGQSAQDEPRYLALALGKAERTRRWCTVSLRSSGTRERQPLWTS